MYVPLASIVHMAQKTVPIVSLGDRGRDRESELARKTVGIKMSKIRAGFMKICWAGL